MASMESNLPGGRNSKILERNRTMEYTYEYPRPALTVDCVVFGLDLVGKNLKLLLIRRNLEPFKDKWALPGGFVQMDETLEDAAIRELREETGLSNIYLEQLYTFGAVDRDPRDRIVTVAYFALVKMNDLELHADTDASDAAWFAIDDYPMLSFDHESILNTAIVRLRGKVRYQPIGFELLPEKFTLSQLQILYEIVLETGLDKRNFRKKILSMGFLNELDEIEKDVSHRAARLYSFNKERYGELIKAGFNFEI
ncbi:MAG: NUDIX hydrolase [Spirochaetaceae bacterium]|nr:NUDIX hydrolase [Spirochaetaceae bacterium]